MLAREKISTCMIYLIFAIRPLQFIYLFDVNFFFQSEEGMRQTNKTPTIKQDEFHRIYFCINMQLCKYAITKTNTGWPRSISGKCRLAYTNTV